MTTYRTVLQFTANDPKAHRKADRRHHRPTDLARLGRPARFSDERVVIRVIGKTDGHEQVLTAWEHGKVAKPLA
ncbi:hypothetical protein [Streptomyces lydicus]|uniref:hypothetical protein n=1 Tax=Streptomyces lydicus TaxID=47763 RepID=UPI0036E5C631